MFVANMSGNSIAVAVGAAQGRWEYALRRGFAVPMSFAGLLIGRLAVDASARRGYRRVASWLFVVEAALLAAMIGAAAGVMHGARVDLQIGREAVASNHGGHGVHFRHPPWRTAPHDAATVMRTGAAAQQP